MCKRFLIADPHFGDERIRRYENRPYANTAQMDAALMANWNRVVSDGDAVYVLGDFGAEGYE